MTLCLRYGSILLVVGWIATASSAAAQASPRATPTPSFSFDRVRAAAKSLAAKPFKEAKVAPKALADLGYDGYRDLRFRPDQAIWRAEGLPFQIQLFHVGFLYNQPVKINIVENGRASELRFRSDLFDYGNQKVGGALTPDLGFAGFRVHHPLNKGEVFDEFAVFLGASYYRLIGANQPYGLSGRGLAVDTASPEGEEFPRFTEFWIEKPARDAKTLTLYALLDSQSVAGAFRFILDPGKRTVAEVVAHLFPRRRIVKLGIAPMSSMFLFGENRLRYDPDFRPEVHDSDGLLVGAGGGRWIWRVLDNPEGSHRVSRYVSDSLTGFGLLQRDRDFQSYQDLETHQEARPSFWIHPYGDWGKGAVELVEIPTEWEANDNIAAYWVPEQIPEPGKELTFAYAVHAYDEDPRWPPTARAQATRITPGKVARFFIDFHGLWLPEMDRYSGVGAYVTATRGEISNVVTQKNAATGGWRTFFDLSTDAKEPLELRATLMLEGRPLSETWTYPWDAR